ncbi:importin-alpha export receptor, partial [Coemansia nantahalensis]
GIVLPNMVLPEADVELFEDDPMQYVRRDVEGSDAGSRREAAAGLVRGLLDQFSAETTQAMGSYITKALKQYAENPAGRWRDKDVALFMATSVAVVASVQSMGATQVNKLVDVGDFFATQVVQHLAAVDSDREAPILKASAVRYVATFRSQLAREQLAQTLPLLVAHLAHPSPAVSAYAAMAVERLLVLKRDGRLAFGPADVAPHAEAILGHAFAALARAGSPQKLAENDFMMKLIMRVIVASRTDILRLAPPALEKLARIVSEVSKNPSNPRFSHFMFEAVASLARFSCAAEGSALAQFEATLFPIFQGILQADVAEFMPYVFQILAQLLGGHGAGAGLPEAYLQLLPPLLQPALWGAQGNIPALVRLLQSYLQTGAAQLAAGGQLQPVLGVFQRLIASRANDHHGFGLLQAVTLLAPADALGQYLKPILSLCLNRLQSSRTAKFTRGFAHYLGFALCTPAAGPEAVVDTMEAIQPGLLAAVLQNVLLEAIPSVAGRVERKATVVGFARLVASPRFQSLPPCAALTGPLLLQLAALLMEATAQPAAAAAAGDAEDLDSLEIEDTGYQASYARLATLGDARLDPCPQIADAAGGLGHVLRPVQASIAAAVQQLPPNVCEFLSNVIAQAA